jgi:hypothetical protein
LLRKRISYGYKKYIKLEKESAIVLDEDKIEADSRWDGLLGVITNESNLILFDKRKRIRYSLPSRISADARKIYDILKVKKTITPYIIKKL